MLLPESASTYAPQVDRLFWVILWITGFFFFLVQACLLLFVLKYRHRAGQYEIRCAELCGLGHYRMKGFVTTEPIGDFQKWLTETKANE